MRKEDLSFLESRRFLPIMLGECGSYFGKDDLFSLLLNYLPDVALGGEQTGSWETLYLYHEEPAGSLIWWSCRPKKETPG